MRAPGLDPVHLLEVAVRPALAALGPQYATEAAEQLVMGTAAKESLLIWLRQRARADGRRGPALGLWQMEPFTFHDLRDRFLSGDAEWKTQIRRGLVTLSPHMMRPDSSELAWNLQLGAAYCRIRYLMARPKLPNADDVAAMALYWKNHYNTKAGDGNPQEFEEAWRDIIAPRFGELWPR